MTEPPLSTPRNSPGFVPPWIAAILASGLIIGAVINVDQAAGIPGRCPVQLVTGKPCPGCGLTRSAVATLNLDLATALSFHAFGPLLVAGAVMILAGFVVERWRGRPLVGKVLAYLPVKLLLLGIALAWSIWAVSRILAHTTH
jgi:hypothetical protein